MAFTKHGTFTRGPWHASPLFDGTQRYRLTCDALPGWEEVVPTGDLATEALYQLQKSYPDISKEDE